MAIILDIWSTLKKYVPWIVILSSSLVFTCSCFMLPLYDTLDWLWLFVFSPLNCKKIFHWLPVDWQFINKGVKGYYPKFIDTFSMLQCQLVWNVVSWRSPSRNYQLFSMVGHSIPKLHQSNQWRCIFWLHINI